MSKKSKELENLQGLADKIRRRINKVSARTLALALRNEHPQTVAATLSFADPSLMARTLLLLPEGLWVEVGLRVANIDEIYPEAMRLIADQTKTYLKLDRGSGPLVGGAPVLAKAVDSMDDETKAAYIESLSQRDPSLADELWRITGGGRTSSGNGD